MAIAIKREFSKKGATSSVLPVDLLVVFLTVFLDFLADRPDVFLVAFLANCLAAAGDFVMIGIPVVCD
jgi:hypothetical protein